MHYFSTLRSYFSRMLNLNNTFYSSITQTIPQKNNKKQLNTITSQSSVLLTQLPRAIEEKISQPDTRATFVQIRNKCPGQRSRIFISLENSTPTLGLCNSTKSPSPFPNFFTPSLLHSVRSIDSIQVARHFSSHRFLMETYCSK